MHKIAFRIRKRYLHAFRIGSKSIEYRRNSDFWRTRIDNLVAKKVLEKIPGREAWMPCNDQELEAVLVSGKDVLRKRIIYIELIDTPTTFSAQGKCDVDTPKCFAFHVSPKRNPLTSDENTRSQ